MSDYDSPWKEVLDVYFQSFMEFFFPQAHADIDWSRNYEALDKELQQVVREAETGRYVVDKLVKVYRRGGEEEWVLIHVEVQGQEVADFSRRMYICNTRLFERYNRLVASLAVLGDERPNWRPDRFGYSIWGCTLDFQFPVVKLLDYARDAASLEASSNPFAVVVLAHLKTQETRQDPFARLSWKTRLVKGLYERGFTSEQVRELFRFIDWLMDLPVEADERFWQDIERYEEEKHMPYVTSVERRAEIRGQLKSIEVVLEAKFGEAGRKLMEEIRLSKDPQKLLAIAREIPRASTPEELRNIWQADS